MSEQQTAHDVGTNVVPNDVRLRVEVSSDGARVALVGELDRQAVPLAYEPLMLAIAARPRQSLALDLSGVTRVDSAGVAMLGTCTRRAAETKTQLALVACSEAARDAMALFQLEQPAEPQSAGPGAFERLGTYATETWQGLVGLISLTADTFYLTFAGSPRTAKVRKGAAWGLSLIHISEPTSPY